MAYTLSKCPFANNSSHTSHTPNLPYHPNNDIFLSKFQTFLWSLHNIFYSYIFPPCTVHIRIPVQVCTVHSFVQSTNFKVQATARSGGSIVRSLKQHFILYYHFNNYNAPSTMQSTVQIHIIASYETFLQSFCNTNNKNKKKNNF